MINRLIGLFIVVVVMWAIQFFNWEGASTGAGAMVSPEPGWISTALALGFMLLSAYILGGFAQKLQLPALTGYLAGGILFGPPVFGLVDQAAVADLEFINLLALAFIAFVAGGELRWVMVKKNFRGLLSMLAGQLGIVGLGVTFVVFILTYWMDFLKEVPLAGRFAIAGLFGVIAVARSPSTVIAIINETRAKGPFTDMVLAVSLVVDVLVLILFAVVISLAQTLLVPGASMELSFVFYLFGEILVSFVLGFALGRGIIYLLDKVHLELPIILAATGFFVIKFSFLLSDFLAEPYP